MSSVSVKALTDRELLSMTEQLEGKRLKRYYKATDKGKETFMEWLSAPNRLKGNGRSTVGTNILLWRVVKRSARHLLARV